MHTFCGTPAYLSPEVFANGFPILGNGCSYTKSTDMWSLGIVVFVSLHQRYVSYLPDGKPSFDDYTRYFESIPNNLKNMDKDWSKYSEEARDFVTRLLTKDPEERMTAAQALQHPWFASPATKSQLPTSDTNQTSPPASKVSILSLRSVPARSLFQQALYQFSYFVQCPQDHSFSKHCNTRTGGVKPCLPNSEKKKWHWMGNRSYNSCTQMIRERVGNV